MAATVRPDQHHVLMRRIGYSVALEPVPVRIPELVDAYAESNVLDRSAWYALCKEWGIPSGIHEGKKKRAEHFLDVVTALGFTLQSEQIVSPAPPLEAGAVVRKIVPEQRAALVQILLLLQIIEADGDIFLNVITSGGDPVIVDERLNDLVERKRAVFLPLFMSSTLKDKLDRIIDIAREETPRGRAPARSPISKDLISKAIDSRSRWAERLGVLEAGELTALGQRLLESLGPLLERTPNGGLILWPYDYQLVALRLSPERLAAKIPVPSVWAVAAAVTASVLGLAGTHSELEGEALVADLQEIHAEYQQLNPGKNALAAQMPLTVASVAHPILSGMRRGEVPDFPNAFARQRDVRESPVVYMKRAGSEGTLIFR